MASPTQAACSRCASRRDCSACAEHAASRPSSSIVTIRCRSARALLDATCWAQLRLADRPMAGDDGRDE